MRKRQLSRCVVERVRGGGRVGAGAGLGPGPGSGRGRARGEVGPGRGGAGRSVCTVVGPTVWAGCAVVRQGMRRDASRPPGARRRSRACRRRRGRGPPGEGRVCPPAVAEPVGGQPQGAETGAQRFHADGAGLPPRAVVLLAGDRPLAGPCGMLVCGDVRWVAPGRWSERCADAPSTRRHSFSAVAVRKARSQHGGPHGICHSPFRGRCSGCGPLGGVGRRSTGRVGVAQVGVVGPTGWCGGGAPGGCHRGPGAGDADAEALRGKSGVRDVLVQAWVAVAATQDAGEVTAGVRRAGAAGGRRPLRCATDTRAVTMTDTRAVTPYGDGTPGRGRLGGGPGPDHGRPAEHGGPGPGDAARSAPLPPPPVSRRCAGDIGSVAAGGRGVPRGRCRPVSPAW
ncbi:hypothetical protein J2Z30_009594 [Streptomyces iranensis]|uniref:Uncharacterized protein n=1 Tax=Streptomyces iranensis TaxID=576784 RepID=A0ABS4N923_9ACTN|nr:hypothetical protein [Streptomyces iranensis]